MLFVPILGASKILQCWRKPPPGPWQGGRGPALLYVSPVLTHLVLVDSAVVTGEVNIVTVLVVVGDHDPLATDPVPLLLHPTPLAVVLIVLVGEDRLATDTPGTLRSAGGCQDGHQEPRQVDNHLSGLTLTVGTIM